MGCSQGLLPPGLTDAAAAAALAEWARLLGLSGPRQPDSTGAVRYTGVVDGRAVEVVGVVNRAARDAHLERSFPIRAQAGR